MKHVAGTKKSNLTLYALSTCGWCRKTKALLNELNADYSYVDVDLLEGKDRDDAVEAIKGWNPACSFPTIVVKGKRCIVGFKEEEIREAVERGN
ncbi:MAG: glutaredoxin family protein [Chloroflexi bacterium]|nr:glutaredoxin family protein [Chloroflexota bacterium]